MPLRFLGAVLAVVVLAGCSGDAMGPTPIPTPSPRPDPIIVDGRLPLPISLGFIVFVPITLTQGGTLDVTLDWSNPVNNLDFLLVRGTCTDIEQPDLFDRCPLVVTTMDLTDLQNIRPSAAKPEHKSGKVQAGEHMLMIWHLGPVEFGPDGEIIEPDPEPIVNYRLVLTPEVSQLP